MEKNGESLLERLMAYGQSDFYPFHMPGHKRREIEDILKDGFPDPYSIDITEIDGFDNLHHAEGILKASMERAAEIYGADRTCYLVNGSTCGILSAVCGCTRPGGKILMARNCHKSAYHGVLLNRLTAEYVYPEFLKEYGINGGIFAGEVEAALENDPDIQAVFLVSPTYEGIVSDIPAIAEAVHRHGIPLIVDEAHGAHFPFGGEDGSFPRPALEAGADVVIQSLHKTLPSLTQTAVLHIKGSRADRERIERYLGIFQSSSPSYVFMAAIERCIRYMDRCGREEMKRYGERMERFAKRAEELKVLKMLTRDVKAEPSVYDWDLSKIVVSVKDAAGLSGEDLGRMLREKYHLEVEMCAPDHVIAMTSIMDTEDGLMRLIKALLEIDKTLEPVKEKGDPVFFRLPRAISAFSMADVSEMRGEKTPIPASEGKVSKEFIYLYPPGIPILAPGERITREILEQVFQYKTMGLSVQGLSDTALAAIITVAEE